MKIEKVYTKNNVFQHIEVIKNNRKKRAKHKEFFVEGAKSITNAVENNWTIKSLIFARDVQLSDWAKGMLKRANAREHIELSLELMQALSDKNEDASELLALVEIPEDHLSKIPLNDAPLILVIDRSSNHGNLGTILRTCEGLGVDGVVLSGHAVDVYDVKTIRASLGTLFSIPVVRVASHHEVASWIDQLRSIYNDLQVLGTSSATEMMIDDAPLKKATLMLIGNETKGLSFKYKDLCDLMVKIPMYGRITSYNVACATSMMLYEANRQRRS